MVKHAMILSQDGILLLIIVKQFHKMPCSVLKELTVFQIMEQIAIQIMGPTAIYLQDIYAQLLMELHHS